VLSVAGAGSDEAAAASMYARHLRAFGFRLPVVLWLRIAGRITSGAMLLRRLSAREFDAHAVQLPNQWQPLLESALIPPDGADACRFDDPAPPRLTLREAEVAALVADGASNAAIADSLGMSEATVKTHLTRVYAKLGVRSRTQLAVTLPQAPEVPVPTLR
jgi:DNA-binding CsgD family transcriptional regulator